MFKDAVTARNKSFEALLTKIKDRINIAIAMGVFSVSECIEKEDIADKVIEILYAKGYNMVYANKILTINWS